MPMKATGRATGPRVIDRWEEGVGWIAHPGEGIARASHAVAGDDGVWVIDPLDAAGIDDLIADLGDVAGVVVLFNLHTRDAAAIAERHGVSVHVPAWMDGAARSIDAPVERVRGDIGDSGFRFRRIADRPFWREAALVGDGTLAAAEAVGTAEHFRAGGERLGVHAFHRPFPPRRVLGDLSPERVLVGHGEGILHDAAAALDDALANARRRAPRAYAENLLWVLTA